jgi:hypothetical protein
MLSNLFPCFLYYNSAFVVTHDFQEMLLKVVFKVRV